MDFLGGNSSGLTKKNEVQIIKNSMLVGDTIRMGNGNRMVLLKEGKSTKMPAGEAQFSRRAGF